MPRPSDVGPMKVADVARIPMELSQSPKRRLRTALPYRVCVATGFAHRRAGQRRPDFGDERRAPGDKLDRWLSETAKRVADEVVMDHAISEGRVLITEDTEFGELAYARSRSSAGIVLVRFHSRARPFKASAVVDTLEKMGERLRGAFYG